SGSGEKSSWLLHRMKDSATAARERPRSSAVIAPASEDSDPPRAMLAETGTPGLVRSLRSPWIEIKWDGIRALGTWADGRMRLHARSGTDITARYPELTGDGAPHFAISDAVIDGERSEERRVGKECRSRGTREE